MHRLLKRFAPKTDESDAAGHVEPAASIVEANAAIASSLPFEDLSEFENARRGFIATDDPLITSNVSGEVIWNRPAYDFITGKAPPSVNPSLWRQAMLNNICGLFQVTDRIYQVRGYDISNMSVIEGDTGRIVVDPLTSVETAQKALALIHRELGERPIVAVIITHTHVDHFGGVKATVSEEDLQSGRVRLIAPRDFMREVVSEHVIGGTVMGRRSVYMYGATLDRADRGHVDSGLGKEPASGSISILPPTDVVDHTGQEMDIDGVRFTFLYAPHAEAPAELTFYLPQFKAFCGAEIVSQNMHNLYSPRGAKVRDALLWSSYIDQALDLFGNRTDVVFNCHHWPVWGADAVCDYLKKQRDTYRYIHDQTLRLASHGMTPDEIAEAMVMPKNLMLSFANRGYYGTTKNNARAVYQYYFGWFDGNPAHLDPLPGEELGKRYVEAMGGPATVFELAQNAYKKGDYRWAATLLNHLVFTAGHAGARELLARVYDQLGYQAESGPWRDIYLTGARELRHGVYEQDPLARADDLLRHIPLDTYFTAMATRLNGPLADGKDMTFNFVFKDAGKTIVVRLENSVLHHKEAEPDPQADASVTLTRELWIKLFNKQAAVRDLLFSRDFKVEGNRIKLLSLFRLLDYPDDNFPIVTL